MAGKEFTYVEKYVSELKKMEDVVQVSSLHANAVNGFEAARQFIRIYNEFKKEYGK
jgi:hypothetical protein